METIIKPLLAYNRIWDFYQTLGILSDLDPSSEFTIYNLSKYTLPTNYQSPLFRANYFSFVFAKDAWGTCKADNHRFEIMPGTVYFNNPEHLKQFKIEEAKDLYLLSVSESFLKENVHSDIFEEFPFLLSEIVPPRLFDPQEFSEFEELYLQIEKTYLSQSLYRNKIIGHLVVALLIKIKENFWNDYNPPFGGNRASAIVRQFKVVIEQHYRNLTNGVNDRVHRLNEYADILSLHPNYLNTVIKAGTGKTVGNWIAEKTIIEAKAMLKNSAIPVKEISCRLGFAEVQHFSSYFKKHTKVTPVLYRQSA